MYLGIDAGGTKTALVLVDRDGAIKATHSAPGAYYFTIGVDALGALLTEAVNAILAKAGLRRDEIEFAFFGLPGFGEDSSLVAALLRLPQQCLPADAYLCGNDMICGWAGSLLCRDGISVVAGTGSICYGERGGATARCGGWGELFSDEGSAYWIACQGLSLFARMSDGRAERGPFYEFVRQELGIAEDLDLCGHIYMRLGGDRAKIAQLSKLVTKAAERGDLQAIAIIRKAAVELALMVDATRRRLGFTLAETVPISYSGGIFDHAVAPLLQQFRASLHALWPRYEVSEPGLPPAIGAALYAAECHGSPLSSEAIARLRAQIGRPGPPGSALQGALES